MRDWLRRFAWHAAPRSWRRAEAGRLNDAACRAHAAGRTGEAIRDLERALALEPGLRPAAHNLALMHLQAAEALRGRGRLHEAHEHCAAAARASPTLAEAHNNLGTSLKDLGRLSEAQAAYRRAVALDPGLAEGHLNLGICLLHDGQEMAARVHFERALELRPGSALALLGLGHVHDLRGERAEAIASYRRAIALDADLAEAHFNHALQLLATGDFENGWREYEWRWRLDTRTTRRPSAPHWDGESLSGRTVLLYAEQGFGDALQFIRYAPLVARRAERVLVRCHPELVDLFSSMPGLGAVAASDDRLPPFDLCAPLMGLPRLFGTTLQTIPAEVPYLRPPPERVREWHARVRRDDGLLQVGIAWASNPETRLGRQKSIRLAALAPLAAHRGIIFHSLQKGTASAEAAGAPSGMTLVDHEARLGCFADTAALIENLDLVITVDTAVAHLAGSLGKPVWTLVSYPAVWRWAHEGETSLWYPTMLLLRQATPGRWDAVIERAAEALRRLAPDRTSGRPPA